METRGNRKRSKMKQKSAKSNLKHVATLTILVAWATTQLSACVAVQLPPIPVTLEVAQEVQVSALAASSGSANVELDAICELFNDAELDAMVREAAGNLIADMTTVTSVTLASTDVTATEGDFVPFTTASLDLMILEPGNETLLLGTAANNDGLGDRFLLTLDMPVDLLNDLEENDCGSPMLHLEGADPFEAEAVTFTVSVNLLVYTEFTVQ